MPVDDMTEPEPEPEPVEPTADDMLAEAVAIERNGQEWLELLVKSMQEPYQTPYDCPRVQHAHNSFLIAAYERMSRIVRSDLPQDKG